MPKINAYEGKIPAFYRRKTIELLMFAHVTALHEKYDVPLMDAIFDFIKMYGINEDEFPIESALTTYHRIRNNFIWCNIKKNLQ